MVFAALAANAQLSNTWEFTTPADYEVSDPQLIQANPADGGRAELILQETLLDQSSLPEYLLSTNAAGVRIGSEQVLELATDGGGKYVAPGVFRSRIIDKGEGSPSWDAFFSRVSNTQLANSPGTIPEASDGLLRLLRLDNDYIDAVTGDPATSVGGSVPFSTTAVVGSHAASFNRNNGYLATSSELTGANALTFSFWFNGPAPQPVVLVPTVFSDGFFQENSAFFNLEFRQRTEFLALNVRTRGSSDRIAIYLDPPMPSRVWTMITMTFDCNTGTLRVYFNKDLIHQSVHGSQPTIQQNGPLYIGTRTDVPGRQMTGLLDEFSVWNRALSEDEVGALFDNLRAAQFRLRTSPTANMSGDFVGPDGTGDSFFYGIADRLEAAGNFNTIHRYLQYEARLFTDGPRSETPQLQYVKFLTRDGQVFTDSTEGDFSRAASLSSLVTAPGTPYTPYFGLARNPNGGFRTSGTYRSAPIDGGDNAVWEQLTWRLPGDIASDDPGLVALYHLDGNWVDAKAGNNPQEQNNTAFSSASRLGFNAARFSEATGGSTVSNFFGGAQSLSTLSVWVKPDNQTDGILSVGGGQVQIQDNQLVTAGFGANSPQIYVNANPQSAVLTPGWNHVVLVWPSAINAQDLIVGAANGSFYDGLLDELALYDTPLTMGQVQVQYYQAHPISSGVPSFRVRADDTLPGLDSASWSSSFTDPGNATFSVQGRYFQYEASFSGDGSGTPTAGDVTVEGNDGVESFTFTTASFPDAADGDFGDGKVAWYGDQIYVDNFAATDPSNLRSSDFEDDDALVGLWHLDENPWEIDTVLSDSSGQGRSGSPVNGAGSSPNARVGFRSGSFDGVDDYVELSQIPELGGNAFSVGFWFQSSDTGPGSLISTYSDSNPYFEIRLNHDGVNPAPGKVAFVVNDYGSGGLRAVVSPAANLNNGNWRHVVGVRSPNYLHLYVDGTRVASEFIGAYPNLAPGTPRIMRNGSGDEYLSGFVDEVAMFGSALSPKKVGTVFSSGYSTKQINEMTFDPVDAGGPTIWQTLRWTADGVYGQPVTPATSVRGLWHLDETAGILAADASGNGLNATANGTTITEGVFGNARLFNGAGDYLQIPHNTLLEAGVFSVEMWVRPTAVNSRTFLDKRSGGNGYALFSDGAGHLTFQLGGTTAIDSLPLLQDVWQHLAATFDGTTMRLYVNGELRGQAVPPGTVSTASGSSLFIGRAASSGGHVAGEIDEIVYYNAALNDTEILDHYRAVAGTMKFQVRSGEALPLEGDFYGPDGTANSYFTRLEENNLTDVVPLEQFLQVKAFIGTDDHRFSPTFMGLSVSASRYPENAPWIAPVFSAGFPFLARLLDFDHTRTFFPDTDVRYQISGDTGTVAQARWFYYSSGSWREQEVNGPNIFDFQTSSRSQIDDNIDTFYNAAYNKTGGVFRFRAFLKSGGDQAVVISNVSVRVSDGRLAVEHPDGQERGPRALTAQVETDVTWTWAGDVSDNVEVAFSLDGMNGPWEVIDTGIAKDPSGTNSIPWTPPATPQNVAAYTNVLVRIRDLDNDSIIDFSDDRFEIVQNFRVIQPDGGEIWYAGETNTVIWESANGLGPNASIYFAPEGDNFYSDAGGYMIVFATPNQTQFGQNTYTWGIPRNVPLLLSTNARIRVQSPPGTFIDDSNEPFAVHGIAITAPTAGQKIKRGATETFDIAWKAIGAGTNVHVDISLDGGLTYETNVYAFVENENGDNTLTWNVTQPETDEAVIRIRSLSDNRVVGISPVFTIAGINVLAPNGGEEWLTGTSQTIEWLSGGAGDTVSIYYTDLYEGTNTAWLPIALQAPNTDSYEWTVSERVSPAARVRVISDEDAGLFAQSENDFNIAGARVTYPNVFAHTLIMDEPAVMTHNAAPTRWPSVVLEISYDREENWELLDAGATPELAGSWGLNAPFSFTPRYPSRQVKVRVRIPGATTPPPDLQPITNVVDTSDEFFEVHGVIMEAPEADSINTLGEQTEIRWVSAGADQVASLYYSSDGTNNYQLIDEGVFNNQTYPGSNPYLWQIPTTLKPSGNATVRVVSGPYSAISESFLLRGIRITAPEKGQILSRGTTEQARWLHAGMSVDAQGPLDLSLDGGLNWTNLVTDYDMISIPFYDWDIPAELDPTTNALLRLTVTNSSAPVDEGFTALSDAFTVQGIKILSPVSSTPAQLGDTLEIRFLAAEAGAIGSIYYSADGGATLGERPIAENIPIQTGLNVVQWQIEEDRLPSTNAVIRIAGTRVQENSQPFTLSGIRVNRPIQFDIWAVGDVSTIEWDAVVDNPIFNVDLLYPDGSTRVVAQNVLGTSRSYTLPAIAMQGESAISNVVLRIRDVANTAEGLSEPFRLVSQPIIEIVSPLEGDFLRVGDEVQVTWVRGGSMDAEDFTVWFSNDGFGPGSTPPEDINRDITFNTDNNTFTMPWIVPDRLGTTQIMVTNSVNANLVSISGAFDIVGAFNVIYPDGDAGEDAVYANELKRVSWFTQGTVEEVHLYYKVGNGDWTLINDTPHDNNPRTGIYQTFYDWKVPIVRSDEVRFRVQDASYSQIFDGTKLGPYDDSDDVFPIRFYTVEWVVGYDEEQEDGSEVFVELDNLSVTDSSGFSRTGIDSPFVTTYPAGTFDTVWSREFFQDKVDFRWESDRNQTGDLARVVVMTSTEAEPEARVMANFSYDHLNTNLTMVSWIERAGRVLPNPDSTTFTFFDARSGDRIEFPAGVSTSSSAVNEGGFFVISLTDVLDYLSRQTPYLVRVEVVYNNTAYSSAVTYTISLGPEFEQVDLILDQLTRMETNLTGQVTNLVGITEGFRDDAMASLGNIEEATSGIATNVQSMRDEVGDFKETIVDPLAVLTNEVVGVIGPSLTNMAEQVEELYEAESSEAARILNRPTTMEYASTNTILYRTARNLEQNVVRLIVEGTGVNVPMREVGVGLGIYSADVVADWGIGSYVITAMDRNYTASDRMVVEVVRAGAASIGELGDVLDSLQSQVTNVTSLVQSFADPESGFAAGFSDLETAISQVEAAIGASGDGTAGAAGAVGELEAANAAFAGNVSAMAAQIESVMGEASDASTAARGARSAAETASTMVQDLQEMLTGEFSMEATQQKVDEIRSLVETSNQTMAGLPQALGTDTIQDELQRVADQIVKMAEVQGYQYDIMLKEQQAAEEGGGAGDGDTDEESIDTLNQNMQEVRTALNFMQQLLDEKINEPVVQEAWLGVE